MYSLDTNWTKTKDHIAVELRDLAFSIRGAREGFLYQGQRGHVAHWDLLEILVRKFKHGNQLVL